MMNLHAFYNKEYIGDILLVRLNGERKVTKHERIDDICILYHNNEIIGYNIFHASLYVHSLTTGKIKISLEFVNELNALLEKYNLKEVESDYDDKFKVGKIIQIEEHPDSDHMHICQVDTGDEVQQIVCGAKNVSLNKIVVVAKLGAVMPNGLIIVPSKLRGIDSYGMLCSARELALPNAPQVPGILILDSNQYQVGDSFFS